MYSNTLADKIKAVDLCSQTHLDVDDAIQYSATQTLEAEGIVSLDKHFDGLKISRMDPGAVVLQP